MRHRAGRAIFVVGFLAIASATLGAGCTSSGGGGGGGTSPWFAAGCYTNSSYSTGLHFSGTPNVVGNASDYPNKTCSRSADGSETIVRASSSALADQACSSLVPGALSTPATLASQGWLDVPSDAWIC
jgi:hypothetical protein